MVKLTSSTDIANIQPFRYRGYYYDYESGFYYLQSRYYDPVTHRFINADGLVSTRTGALISFKTYSAFEPDPNINDPRVKRFGPMISVNQGPVHISEVKILWME